MIITFNNLDTVLLTQFRKKIYFLSLGLLISLSTLLVIVYDMVRSHYSLEVMGAWFLCLCTCGVSFLLNQYSLKLATHSLFLGLIVVFAFLLHSHPSEVLLTLVPIILPIATLLLGRRNSFLLVLLALLVVISSPLPVLQNGDVTPYLLVVLLAFLTSVITVEGFYELLNAMHDYQSYALDQMKEARERRGILAKRTKQLAISTESLNYANRQLRVAKRKIEEAHKLKAQFAANVSHELRTPINLIVGFAETIVRFPKVYSHPLPSEYLSDVRSIYRNGKHLQNLINDILDISQIESGHMALVKEEIAIGDVIHEALNLLQNQIKNTGLSLHVDLPDDLPVMWLDRVRIRQVFINLLGNAIRFTDAGHISVTASEDEANLMICVADTGIGIPNGEEEKIFEEFYQANMINRRNGGSGLGLTLSRRFVRMHKGEIWAESKNKDASGSQFWIKLPIDFRSDANLTDSGQPLPTEKNNVIVLNTDPRVIEFFERHLNRQHVIAVDSFNAVLSHLETNPAALIMDKRDCDILQKNQAHQIIMDRVTVITCPMPSGRRQMMTLGAADYLVKPISADVLKQSIHQLSIVPEHILIVDDEQEIVRLFGRLLKAILPDARITMAYTGQEALALLDMIHPDLVILDIMMPDVDGITVLETIKNTPESADIPIIIASAKGASEAISPSDHGNLFIQKPNGFQPLELLKCIETVVDCLSPLT